MQPTNSMIPSPMAQPPQYRPQQWMPQQTQQTQYQVPPPQQPAAAAGYYYQQPPLGAPTQQPELYGVAPVAQAPADDGIRSLWIGDLQYWMDEQYIYSCFALTGEVVSAKVIRNKQAGQSEGYGFIQFSSHAAAERNLLTYNGTQMPNSEQTFRLNWASMGAGEKHDDTPEYTIFVGDLAADVTDYMLQETFRANYSSVKGAKVVTDKITGRTKGYGFVRFGDESEQLRAMAEMNGRYCSTRPMRIGPAASKQKVGGLAKGCQEALSYRGLELVSAEMITLLVPASYQTSQGTQGEDDPTNTTIFVGNLDSNITDEHLRQIFGQYGQLLHVKIPVGKRCGFVQFADRSCAEEALRMLNGTQLGGQSIRLSWGRSPSNKQVDQNQSNAGYYGYAPGYETYGYAQAAQDPNLYYGGYQGYGNYAPPPQQPPQ